VSALLTGPAQPAEIVGSFPVAVYLRTAAGIVSVVTPGATRLPNAVLCTDDDHARVFRNAREYAVRVGDGGVRAGPWHLEVGRWWDPVPRLRHTDPRSLARNLRTMRSALPAWPEPSGPLDHRAANTGQNADHAGEVLVRRLSAGRQVLSAALAGEATLGRAAGDLVGLGPGLTPAGDDLLAGAIAALVTFGRALDCEAAVTTGRLLGAEAAARASRTTPLAADLTGHAAAGAVAAPVAAVCHALVGRRPLRPALERLLAVGHTSGRDLAEGLALGASAAVASASSAAVKHS